MTRSGGIGLASGSSQAGRLELLVVTAPWCRQCTAMEQDLNRLSPPAGLRVVRVDAAEDPDLVADLGIRSTPTFVAVEDGRELWRSSGRRSAVELDQMLADLRKHRPGTADLVVRSIAGVTLAVVGSLFGSWVLMSSGVVAIAWGLAGWIRFLR